MRSYSCASSSPEHQVGSARPSSPSSSRKVITSSGSPHDIAFSGNYALAAQSDLRAVETIGEALKGSDRPLVIASGLAGLPAGRVATEHDRPDADGPGGDRAAASQTTLALAAHGVRASVVRLPPTVHGAGDPGFVAALVGIARERGVSGYVDDGSNRWPAVHRVDAAHLFRLALEGAAPGSVLHGIAEEGVRIRDVAGVIGRRLELPVISVPRADASQHLGWLARLIGGDHPASSDLTRELLSWRPAHPGLVEDVEQGHYFASPGRSDPEDTVARRTTDHE